MSTHTLRDQKPPDDGRNSYAKDHHTGLIFQTWEDLQRWRYRHGVLDDGSSSIPDDWIDDRPILTADAPAPSSLRDWNIEHRDLLDDVRRVAQQLDRTPTRDDYASHGQYGSSTARERFGDWYGVLEAAGLPSYPPGASEREREALYRMHLELEDHQ